MRAIQAAVVATCGIALLCVLAFALAVSATTVHQMATRTDCPLPSLNFDIATAELVDVTYLPPAVECRYSLYDGQTWTEHRTRWRVLSPLPIALALAGTVWWTILRRKPTSERQDSGAEAWSCRADRGGGNPSDQSAP